MTKELERNYILSDYVEDKTLKDIIVGINRVIDHDNKEEEKLKEYKREPIHLIIDSYGGYCYDGLALANLIRSSKTPVYTYVYGKAMSMGLYLFLTGTKRFIHEDATLMYHQLSTGTWGTMKSVEVSVGQSKKLHKLLTKYICSRISKKAVKKVEKHNHEQTDWYMSGKKALKFGFATDEIKDAI